MRTAIVKNGLVIGLLDLADKNIATDGKSASGPASYFVIEDGEQNEVSYIATVEAGEDEIFIASETAEIGWAYGPNGFITPDGSDDLDAIKRSLIADVNAAAEAERLKYITPGAGQALTYQEKLAQARACLAATSPVSADYPMLANEIGITGANVAAVAQVVVNAYGYWQIVGAAIEKIRMEANKAIAEAISESAARAARAAITWP